MVKKIWAGYWCDEIRLSDDDWSLLEKISNIHLSCDHRVNIHSAMNTYNEHITGYRKAARPSEIRPILDDISDAAEALSACLQKLYDDNVGHIAERWLRFSSINDPLGNQNPFDLRRDVIRLSYLANKASKSLPDDRGANGDPYKNDLIKVLHRIYKESGGRGKYTKNSLAFIRESCRLAGAGVLPTTDIKEWVKEAFRKKPSKD